MALFDREEELQGSSPFKSFSPNEELSIGEGFCFYFYDTAAATSPEYGDFTLCNGVKFNCDSQTEKELNDSMELSSFVLNTLLLNKISSGLMKPGLVYHVVKKWNRGDKYEGNKKAKGYGYSISIMHANPALLKSFADFVSATVDNLPTGESGEADGFAAPKVNI